MPVFIGGPKNQDWIKTPENRKRTKKITKDLQKKHQEQPTDEPPGEK